MISDIRGMKRREFSRIARSELAFCHMETEGFAGWAGLLDISDVSEVWKVRGRNGEVIIADRGYTWLQLSPDTGGWWLTVMYDPDGRLKQYYFDITLDNFVDSDGVPGFSDLYLDIVLNPDGTWVMLDRDELDAALDSGEISREVHDLAVERAEHVLEMIDGRETYWRTLCANVTEHIRQNGKKERQ